MMFQNQAAAVSHAKKNSLKPDWPALPLMVASGLILWRVLHGEIAAWSADIAALLVAFSIAKISQNVAAHSLFLAHSSARWVTLFLGFVLAVTLGLVAHKFLWPHLVVPHPSWLIPCVLLCFISAAILPGAFNAEVARKADETLRAEEIKHRVERQLLEARLAALQGQIEPHFLYNTLANARALIRQDAVAAETMLNHLIAYLRAAMPDLRSPTTTLGQELDRAEAYLQIMQIRLGERLRFSIAASEEARNCMIPPLGVMTLVENAIKHAIEPMRAGGILEIFAACDSGNLTVNVIDNGAGFQAEGGDGIGLINLQQRMQAFFGETAELSLKPGTISGIIASIKLPVKVETSS